jgi:hypothetical protein
MSQPIEGQILNGYLFNEPMCVETVASNGAESWVLGLVGLQSEKFRKVTLTAADLKSLTIQNTTKSYDGDGPWASIDAAFVVVTEAFSCVPCDVAWATSAGPL